MILVDKKQSATKAKLSRLQGKIGQTKLDFKSRIRCGFELETQATDGMTHDGGDGEVDYDSASEAIWELISDEMSDVYGIIDSYLNDHFLAQLNHKQLEDVMIALKCFSLYDLSEIDDTIEFDSIEEQVRDYVEQDFDYSAYCESGCDQISVPHGLVCGWDSTVDGFEIRTDGPNTYARFISLASKLFKMDHEIDSACSFHIHLSVDGIKHIGGKKLISLASEYVLNNIFKYGWAHDRMENRTYFDPSVDGSDKYSLIHFHSEFKTFEFRIFGNISNAVEAREALNLAIDALWFAYNKLIQGDTETVGINNFDWMELCKESMKQRTPLNEIVIKDRFEKSLIDLQSKYSKAA